MAKGTPTWVKFRFPREDEPVIVKFSNGEYQIVSWNEETGFHTHHDLDGSEVVAWAYLAPLELKDPE